MRAQSSSRCSGPAAARVETEIRSPLEVEPGSVCVGLAPDRVAAAGVKPRQRRVIALRDAALDEHLRRAVGGGVAAIGAELDVAARLVEPGAVTDSQADEALLRAAIPVERQPQRLAVGFELERDPVVAAQLEAQARRATAVQADRRAVHDLLVAGRPPGAQRPLGGALLLARDHALGELQEVIGDRAVGHPHAGRADQPAPVATHRERERPQGDLDAQLAALEDELIGDRVRRHGRNGSATATGTMPSVHEMVTGRNRVLHGPTGVRRPILWP